MLDVAVFIKVFCPVFLVVASIGPCLLTYANISMNYGYKKGFIAASGCFTVDVLYITFGIFAIETIKLLIPEKLFLAFGIFAGCFLLYLAYGFWKTNAEKLEAKRVENNSLSIYLKLLFLTLSNPIAIIGYAAIFSSIGDIRANVFSIFLSATSAAFIAHSVVVLLFATLGKKINMKILLLLNKIFALIISMFAVGILVKIFKTLMFV